MGLVEGASENAAAARALLKDLVARGVKPDRRRLFVIDGSKALRAAYRLDPKEGMARLRKQAEWLEREHPTAASSLREGLEETFTVNAMGLPAELRRCLATTNIIESPQSGVRQRTRRVTRWKDGAMVVRWAATALVETEKRFRRIMGYQQLWILKSYLDRPQTNEDLGAERKAG